MGPYMIPAGTFFTDSPDIRIRCVKDNDEFVRDTLNREEGETNKGLDRNCFSRPRSDKERDGHLARLRGVRRMHSFLHQMGDKATVLYHGEEKGWLMNNFESTHPCGMLSYNDKWWMIHYDEKHLSRYSWTKREEKSCVPSQLRDGMWHKYSCQCCLYCNGDYDDTIKRELGLTTKGNNTTCGPWTE